ncbi:MAG: FGGY-family carbohydrate kinase [bacterium]|nr:FGGY-family carbohydrate kinase [bacterium]
MDRGGGISTAAGMAYPDGQTPHDPRVWWTTFVEVIARLRAAAQVWNLAGVVLCGRGRGLALLDEAERPLVFPWDAVEARVSAVAPYVSNQHARIASWANLVAAVRHAAPGVGTRIRAVLTVKDYVNFCLTGRKATDPGSAGAESWPPASGFGLDGIALPGILSGDQLLGEATRAGLAIEPGTPVFVGSHDGVCANVGAGMLRPDEGCVTLGTTGVIRINTPTPVFLNESLNTFTYPFPAGAWTSGAEAVGTGSAIIWAARLFGLFDGRPEQFDTGLAALDRLIASAPPGSEGVLFLPRLRDILSPRSAPDARAAFHELTSRHTAAHLARAVMEASGFSLRMLSDALALQDVRARTLALTGGGAKSAVWPQIMADVLDRPLHLAAPEASARGAAMLGAVGLGWYEDLHSATLGMASLGGTITPAGEHRALYRGAYERFTKLVGRAEAAHPA